MIPAIILGVIIVVCCVFIASAQGNAKQVGPSTHAVGSPVVEGELIYVAEFPFGPPSRVSNKVCLFSQRDSFTGRCELKDKSRWGKYKSLEVFFYKRGHKIEGRFPNGTMVNTVEGWIDDTRAKLTIGFPRYLPRSPLCFRIDRGSLRLDKTPLVDKKMSRLVVESSRITGKLHLDKSIYVEVDLDCDEASATLAVLGTLLISRALCQVLDND